MAQRHVRLAILRSIARSDAYRHLRQQLIAPACDVWFEPAMGWIADYRIRDCPTESALFVVAAASVGFGDVQAVVRVSNDVSESSKPNGEVLYVRSGSELSG